MNRQRANIGTNRQQTVTSFDDWETDPDYIRDMDETEQRWGSKRTVGSINMNDLINQVNKEHKLIGEETRHPSQRLGGFGYDDTSKSFREPVHGYEERLSKHSSTQEISRKVYTSTSGSESGIRDSHPLEKKTILTRPEIATKPDYIQHSTSTSTYPYKTYATTEPKRYDSSERIIKTNSPSSPYRESTSRRIFKEEKSSTSSSKDNLSSMPNTFKSIHDKIDAFKKEFEDIESKVSRKSDISKVIKKSSSNYETKQSSSDLNQVPRNYNSASSTYAKSTSDSGRPNSTTPTRGDYLPKADIKGLSKRFETLCRESDEDFKRRTDARRREFFDEIKSQVRETRKNFDDIEPIDQDRHYGKPKVYSRSETTKEEIVSKVVKENDKIVENETKRNVERSSSCHGSSDDESIEPSSIRYINQQLNKSPTQHIRTQSPIDEIRKKVPVIETPAKGAGLMARTLYDYQATEDDELTFDVDDLITNIEKVHKEWYKGTMNKGGRRVIGLFPASYVKLLNDSGEY